MRPPTEAAYTTEQMSNRTLGVVIFLVALAIWIAVYWFFLSHSYQIRPQGNSAFPIPADNGAKLEGPMTSEAEMRFLKEFGPRVAALVNRLQEAAGVRELRTRADLDILAAAALELLTSALANMPEPMRCQRVRGLSETLAADVEKKREQLGLDVLQQTPPKGSA